MADRLETYLKEVDVEQKHASIFKAMTFPDASTRTETPEKAVLQTTFTCDDTSCDFSRAYDDIKNSASLLKWQSRGTVTQIVEDIDQHQADYFPKVVDGYFINHMGHQLVHLKRTGPELSKEVVGVIEYHTLQRQSVDHYANKKVERTERVLKQANDSSFNFNVLSCTIQ